MRKYLKYILFFVGIIFVLPALCTKRTVSTVSVTEEKTDVAVKEENKLYDYSQYATIKLYHTKTQSIEELPMDQYLYGVVSAEMPANFEIEALKAQAIVARTYTLYQIINGKNKHGDAHMCDSSTCCQAWISKDDRLSKWAENDREGNWNKIMEAVNSTSGKIVTYEGAPIDAFFHSNSGGRTEVVSNVWGGSDLPYLQSVETSGESEYSQYNSEVIISKEELIDKLKGSYADITINFSEENCIQILEHTASR